MEFETIKYWLKSCDSNKVIIEVVQEKILYKLVGMVQSLVANWSIKQKEKQFMASKF